MSSNMTPGSQNTEVKSLISRDKRLSVTETSFKCHLSYFQLRLAAVPNTLCRPCLLTDANARVNKVVFFLSLLPFYGTSLIKLLVFPVVQY